jgi:hypothetical protein
VWSAIRGNLRGNGSNANSLWPSVVADAVIDGGAVNDDVAFVYIRDVNVADVGDGAVVVELIIVPVSALISASYVAKAIVHSAIEADITAPIASDQAIAAAEESPVSGSPESAFIRRCSPGAGHPVIAVGGIIPVTRGPEITGFRDRRLLVFGKFGRRLGCVFLGSWVVVGVAVLLVRRIVC